MVLRAFPATVALAALLLSACGQPGSTPATTPANAAGATANEPVAAGPGAPPAPAAVPATDTPLTAAAPTQAQYLGRWTGVEGTFLDVAAKPSGGVTLTMQYDLDHKGTFDGSVTAEGLRFTRGGKPMVAVPTDGDATGLKWLAGKKDCLTVQPGEGYCRR